MLYLLWAVPSIWLCAVFDICYSLNFGFVLYLLCAIPSILAVGYISNCCVLFPRFWLCPVFAVCYICGVLFSPSVLARACTRARLCAVFALCYSLNFGCVLFLLYAMPSILAVCYICCVLFPQFWLWAIFAACVLFPQFGCVLYYLLCAIPSISAVFAVGYSLNFGCVRYSLYLERPTYCTVYDGYLEFVCLVVFNWSLFLRKCVRKKSHPNLNSLLPGIGE